MEFKNVPEKHVFENINFWPVHEIFVITLTSSGGSDETLQYTVSSEPSLFTYTRTDVNLSYDIASESEITPCIKIDKPLVVYRFSVNAM